MPPIVLWDESSFNNLFNYDLLNSEYEDWKIEVHIGNQIYTNEKDFLKGDELYIDVLDRQLRNIFGQGRS